MEAHATFSPTRVSRFESMPVAFRTRVWWPNIFLDWSFKSCSARTSQIIEKRPNVLCYNLQNLLWRSSVESRQNF
jgi:hypothetical protein